MADIVDVLAQSGLSVDKVHHSLERTKRQGRAERGIMYQNGSSIVCLQRIQAGLRR